MKSNLLLTKALDLVLVNLQSKIISFKSDFNRNNLKLELQKGITLHLRYNNYSEYSYVVTFSPQKYDRIRFDNYDKEWNVSTKPHHCHLRYSDQVAASPFTGDPDNDIPELSDLINTGNFTKYERK